MNIDIIIVKHFNSDYQTGIYSSSALLSKIIFFLTLFLTNINFRETLSSTNSKSKKIIINLISMIIIIFFSLIMFVFFKFFDSLIFKLTFGDNFIEGKLYFYKQLVHFTILSLIALITYICISYNIYLNLIISILFYIFLFIFLNLYKTLLISSFLNILILFDFIVLFINMLFLFYMYKFKIK